MRKSVPRVANVNFTKNETTKNHQKDSDEHTRIKAVNEMISQLERVKGELTKKKNDIHRIESFLNDFAVPLNEKNRELEEIIKKENKKKLLNKFTKLKENCNLRQKIKAIRSRPMLVIEAAFLFQLSFLFFFVVTDFDSIQQSGQVDAEPGNVLKSKYLIQNLNGDAIDTFLSWRLVEGEVLHVNILNADKFPEKSEIIKNIITSDEIVEIDDSITHKGHKGFTSTYYQGWKAALELASAKKDTELYIPINFDIVESKRGEGDITIYLSTLISEDGVAGYTKSIADSNQNQILKSQITIYGVDSLTNEELETITRHEFGHALGLGHSTDPDDLMHPVITTGIPYIADCNIEALVLLYDGEKSPQVVCEK